MDCDRASRLLHPLVDGELGRIGRHRLRRHVGACAGCSARLAELQALQTALRTRLQHHRAPPALAARIGAAIAREAPGPGPVRRRVIEPWFAAAGTGLAGAVAGVALTLLVTASPVRPDGEIVRAVIDSHVRSLLPDHLTEVLTSDRHTVKPWLSSRLDVSPPVRDLAEAGFPLIGGRLDYVDGHQVGCVVYRHDKHVINLLAWSSPGLPDEGFRTLSRQGFNLVTWRKDGATFWAVSDLEGAELQGFARRIAGPDRG